MVGRPGKRSEGGRRVLTGYSFPWIPYCEVDSVPFNRSLWSSQGVLLDLTLSPPDSVATEPIIHSGTGVVTVRQLRALGDSPVYCGSPNSIAFIINPFRK